MAENFSSIPFLRKIEKDELLYKKRRNQKRAEDRLRREDDGEERSPDNRCVLNIETVQNE